MRYFIPILIIGFLAFCGRPARYQQQSAPISAQPTQGLYALIEEWLGVPYLYGGTSRSGVDCSGFTMTIMSRIYQIELPRTAQQQYRIGTPVRRGELQTADLVFFSNIRSRGIDHVGIYLGNNRFVHATESAGVTISELDETYYRQHFTGARRFLVR